MDLSYARPADFDRKYHFYHYKHIFDYLWYNKEKREENTLQPLVNNSQTLNLILCRKRKLNPERISLQKRKVQHRGRRIQRKKHAKIKAQRARLTAGLLIYSNSQILVDVTSNVGNDIVGIIADRI